jgi:hypothetical protein
VPEGWTISEYKSFKATGDTDSSTDSSTDGDSSDDEQIFSKAKTKTFIKKKFKRIHKEELLPE